MPASIDWPAWRSLDGAFATRLAMGQGV